MEGRGITMLPQVVSRIRDCDLTIADLSRVRANIVFEMGISLGLRKRLVTIQRSGSEKAS